MCSGHVPRTGPADMLPMLLDDVLHVHLLVLMITREGLSSQFPHWAFHSELWGQLSETCPS